MALVVKRVSNPITAYSPSVLVPQEVKMLLRYYFDGAMRKWENEDSLQKDRAIRYLTDLEKIPSTGRRLWDALTADQMDAIRDEIGGLRVRVENQNRPGWLIHCLKCWCGYSDKNDPEFKEWPKLKEMHVKRAIRELWPRLTKALNGEYQ